MDCTSGTAQIAYASRGMALRKLVRGRADVRGQRNAGEEIRPRRADVRVGGLERMLGLKDVRALEEHRGGQAHRNIRPQDLPAQYPSEINHRSPDAFMILQHNVRCLRTGKLYSVTGKESLKVSSIHHQAVKKLACGFKASAFADDGAMESIESDSEHIWGVQFHPELQAVEGDEAMKKLFVYFISQARTLSC